jgi:SNF2 family DNA or RNA helicase
LIVAHWLSVIFEEGHKFCTSETDHAKAAKMLRELFKLLVTGIPIQNEYSDCRSLMEVMGVFPASDARAFDHYYLRSPTSEINKAGYEGRKAM